MKRLSRRRFVTYSLSVAGAALTEHLLGPTATLASDRDEGALKVGYLPISDHLILPVSHALDGSKYAHLRVTPVLCESWDEMIGKVDMGILHAAFMLAPLAMHQSSLGSPLRCVLLAHRNGSVIAARPSISDSRALSKHLIGIPHSKSTHRVLLYKYFKDHGIENLGEVRLVKVPPPLTIEHMESGRIDAYSVAEPWGRIGVSTGVARILEHSKNIIADHACCVVMVHGRFLERHPDAVAEWSESLKRAGWFIHDDPDAAGRLQAPYMNHDPGAIAAIARGGMISYHDLVPDRPTLETLHEQSRECGVLAEDCDLDRFVVSGFAGSSRIRSINS